MKLYRKKPVVIEARKFEYTSQCLLELSEWMGANMKTSGKARHKDAKGYLEVMTLEDGEGKRKIAHIATEGDYIIKGVQGEFYACKPDIFEMTYEAVEDEKI